MKWNSEVKLLIIIVISLVVLPVSYVALFSAQALNSINKPTQQSAVQAYFSRDECELEANSTCEPIVTADGEEYWILRGN